MNIFPAIDLFDSKAVRLYKGDYNQMTVYSTDPLKVALDFKKSNAKYIHIVDLEGAKDGTTPNLDLIIKIKKETGLFVEVGGGIRSMEVIDKYLENGIDRVILGTIAVKNIELLKKAQEKYKDKIAVSVDVKDGYVAIKGWVEKSNILLYDFLKMMEELNIKYIICTDISKDGAMNGTNLELYKKINEEYDLNIIASGGVSSINDIKKLKDMNMYGAIIGKAYYIKAIDLKEAISISNDN